MAGQILKVLLTFQIFEYSSLREDLIEVSTVGIISPQLVNLFFSPLVFSSLKLMYVQDVIKRTAATIL